jgi:chromosome segregation ATPase
MKKMKRILLMALLATALGACNEKKGGSASDDDSSAMSDSIAALERENQKLRNETDDLLAAINEIEEGFRQINEAQGNLTIAKRGEGANTLERIKEDMQFIQETMAQNAALIEKLKKRLTESGRMTDQLQRTLDNLTAQLDQKNTEIAQLRKELGAKNIHIAELDEQVEELNRNVTDLQEQTQKQDAAISKQDAQLHTAWYAIGTKKELKNANILKSGSLQGNFDQAYFTKVDIRQMTTLNLNSKSAELLTTHPKGSYTLERGQNKLYTLNITDAKAFWSISKYLVVQIK